MVIPLYKYEYTQNSRVDEDERRQYIIYWDL